MAMAGERENEWESIIPEDKIKKMEDEEREKVCNCFFCGEIIDSLGMQMLMSSG